MSHRIKARLHERSVRLPSTVGNSRRQWSDRRALLLEIVDGSGVVGLGEASPLPGYSPDGFDAAASALGAWAASGAHLRADETPLEAARRLGAAVDPESPAARFAVETAVLDFLGRRLERPVSHFLDRRRDEIEVAELLPSPDRTSGLEAADRAVMRGITTLKIKVGRQGAFGDELHLLEALRDEHGDSISIRLDANGSFPEDELARRLSALAAFRPELIEEPVPRPALGRLVRSPIGLAADESLQHPAALEDLTPVVEAGKLAALVLKPMALGGFIRCLELADWAAQRKVPCFVTHLWDGPVALAAAAQLALALPSEILPCGLGRHAAIDAWPAIELPFHDRARVAAIDRPGLGVDHAPLLAK